MREREKKREIKRQTQRESERFRERERERLRSNLRKTFHDFLFSHLQVAVSLLLISFKWKSIFSVKAIHSLNID